MQKVQHKEKQNIACATLSSRIDCNYFGCSFLTLLVQMFMLFFTDAPIRLSSFINYYKAHCTQPQPRLLLYRHEVLFVFVAFCLDFFFLFSQTGLFVQHGSLRLLDFVLKMDQ